MGAAGLASSARQPRTQPAAAMPMIVLKYPMLPPKPSPAMHRPKTPQWWSKWQTQRLHVLQWCMFSSSRRHTRQRTPGRGEGEGWGQGKTVLSALAAFNDGGCFCTATPNRGPSPDPNSLRALCLSCLAV